ncbi:hypothetical protein [Natronobiforma cellulositropha]|uniref:hypothetical protein n=1 Tax=Natronobiforma cellulositropha TaxID=1679076 RepID=UPI0021D5EE3B|nr:hypothetical protein [Natronobiforma cellulositropha]
MGTFSDRLVIVLIAATGLAVLLVGWAGGLVEAQVSGWLETALLALLALGFLAALVGVWFEFGSLE